MDFIRAMKAGSLLKQSGGGLLSGFAPKTSVIDFKCLAIDKSLAWCMWQIES
jgi:hypothetical protein